MQSLKIRSSCFVLVSPLWFSGWKDWNKWLRPPCWGICFQCYSPLWCTPIFKPSLLLTPWCLSWCSSCFTPARLCTTLLQSSWMIEIHERLWSLIFSWFFFFRLLFYWRPSPHFSLRSPSYWVALWGREQRLVLLMISKIFTSAPSGCLVTFCSGWIPSLLFIYLKEF